MIAEFKSKRKKKLKKLNIVAYFIDYKFSVKVCLHIRSSEETAICSHRSSKD